MAYFQKSILEKNDNNLLKIFQMFLEVRPRLGSVNAYLPNKKGFSSVSVPENGEEIIIKHENHEKGVLNFPWPLQQFGPLCYKSIHGLSYDKNGLNFRLRFKGSQLSLLNHHRSLKIRRNFIKPGRLSMDKENLELLCSNCQALVTNLNVQRYLPLPSSDWRGGINDWFCACTHGSVPKGADSNKRLHEKTLGPKESDLFYSHCYIRIHQGSHVLTNNDNNSVTCKKCQVYLGTWPMSSLRLCNFEKITPVCLHFYKKDSCYLNFWKKMVDM